MKIRAANKENAKCVGLPEWLCTMMKLTNGTHIDFEPIRNPDGSPNTEECKMKVIVR
jgi:hypothetical protein